MTDKTIVKSKITGSWMSEKWSSFKKGNKPCITWGIGKCKTNHFSSVALICIICQFCWCKYFHCGWFQAANNTSLIPSLFFLSLYRYKFRPLLFSLFLKNSFITFLARQVYSHKFSQFFFEKVIIFLSLL